MARKKKTTKRKKTTRASKRRTRTKKKSDKPGILHMLIISVVAIILLSYIVGIILGNGNGNGLLNNPPALTQPTINNYQCQKNSECFTVWCKNNEATKECVNTETMEKYHEICGDFNDVRVDRDYTECSCVEGYCK